MSEAEKVRAMFEAYYMQQHGEEAFSGPLKLRNKNGNYSMIGKVALNAYLAGMRGQIILSAK